MHVAVYWIVGGSACGDTIVSGSTWVSVCGSTFSSACGGTQPGGFFCVTTLKAVNNFYSYFLAAANLL